jgi:hypothetical protein
MPRPKPPAPLIGRQIRLSDKQFLILDQLGGAKWLRELLEKKAPMPNQYYEKIFGKTNDIWWQKNENWDRELIYKLMPKIRYFYHRKCGENLKSLNNGR